MAIYRGVGGSGDSATGEDVFGSNSSITDLQGITGSIQTPTYIKFAADAAHTANQGELTWNSSEGTLDLGLNGGAVVLQIGQELHYRVTNLSGVTIDNGTLVAYAGTTGNSGKLLVEAYDGTQPSKFILGLATEDIINGSNGYVTCFGKVRGIQTNGGNYGETWGDGDEIYPSATGLTNVLPTAPNAKQVIGYVVNAHPSNGELFIQVQGHTSLEDDELVELVSLTNGDILQYNSVNGRFENVSLSTAGIQPTLVSGVNIKTINSESLLGSTDILVTTAADIANMLETTDIGVTVQGYDADTAKYDDVTANFTGTLQNGGSNVVVDSDIGSTVLAYDSNLQGFVNTFTLPIVDGTNGFVLTTDGAGTLSLAAPGGIPDGDKGDITVSAGGTVWTIDAGAVDTTKLGGDITTAGKNLLNDATVADQRTTLGLGSVALQGDGDKGDITVSATGATWTIDNDVVTNAKLNTDAKFGRLLNIQVFTASGTYTPTAGTKSIIVEQCGGGGGGGGADGGGAGTTSNPRSAGGGAYALKRITNMNQTFTVTIGAGGAGGAAGNNAGADGGTTTFSQSVDGDIVTTGGGGGGSNAATAGNQVGGSTLGGTATGGDINLDGGNSTSRAVLSGYPASFSTSGASPRFGGGKTALSAATDGTNATNYGEGGSSACSYNVTTNYAGGNGFQGVVIVWEYA